jgi:hypothetical protein
VPPRFRSDDERAFALERPVTRIGHAFVLDTPVGTVLLHDGGPEGIYVNGRRVERAILEPGDEIAVGDVRLVYLAA